MIDRRKSLSELENDDWGEPDYPSNLVVSCHAMRYKPVAELTDGELRIAIGQQFSLPILVPLALERLETDPMLEADFYQGDLFKFVLSAKSDFWSEHPDLWHRTHSVAEVAWTQAASMDSGWMKTIEPDLRRSFALFLEHQPKVR